MGRFLVVNARQWIYALGVPLLAFAVVLTGITPAATATALVAVAPVVGQPCTSAGDSAGQLAPGIQCVAEEGRHTRGFQKVECIQDPKALQPGAKYDETECKKSKNFAEGIAHARAIAKLNHEGVYGESGDFGKITLNLQWETVIPGGGRPDLLLYNRADPNGPVGLVEIKVDEAGRGPGRLGPKGGIAQMDRYIEPLN